MAYFFTPYINGWSVDSNGAFSSIDSTGSELISNGEFTSWSSATNASSWTEFLNGASTINQDSVVFNVAPSSARLDIDGSNNLAYFQQSALAPHGKWVKLLHSWRVNSGTATVSMQSSTGTLVIANAVRTIDTNWQQFIDTARNNGSISFAAKPAPVSAAGKSVNLDSISVKLLDETKLYAVAYAGVSNVPVTCRIRTIHPGTQAGVVGWLDNYTTRQNLINAYHDGVNVNLEKCVNGAYSSLIGATATFVADAKLEIRRPSGNNFELWYNGVQYGATQVINDASIINNGYFGMLSTYSVNRISEFQINSITVNPAKSFGIGYDRSSGYQFIKRNNVLISVFNETLLTPLIHTGWAINNVGLLFGTGLILSKPVLIRTTDKISASINTYAASTAGVVANADTTTPTNYLHAYYNGTQIRLDKIVGGVTTNLVSSALSFVANASIEIRRTATATFQVWYNGVQVGSNQTVNDAAIQSGKYFGINSGNSGNLFANLIINNNNLPFIL